MPQIRRHNLPPHLLDHLLDRVSRRNISADQLGLMADWLRTEPEVPDSPWLKRFPGLTVCGEGELVKAFLQPGRVFEVNPESTIAHVRGKLGLSQSIFAAILGISADTLQHWEQGRRRPTGPAKVLLRIAAKHPEVLLDVA